MYRVVFRLALGSLGWFWRRVGGRLRGRPGACSSGMLTGRLRVGYGGGLRDRCLVGVVGRSWGKA